MIQFTNGSQVIGAGMELWDAYNSELEKIEGMTLVRGQENEIPAGVYHLVCDILVKHEDGSYLLMKRDPVKSFGGMWEATAGGSALQGETPYDCAKREIYEETGISSDDLKEIGRVVCDKVHCIYVEFFCITGCNKNSIVLQEGETCDYKWTTRNELLNMLDELVTRRIFDFTEDFKGKI